MNIHQILSKCYDYRTVLSKQYGKNLINCCATANLVIMKDLQKHVDFCIARSNDFGHCFLLYKKSLIIDVTSSQFNRKKYGDIFVCHIDAVKRGEYWWKNYNIFTSYQSARNGVIQHTRR